MYNNGTMEMQYGKQNAGISAFWLKIIAIAGMLLQHSALALPGAFPLGFEIFLQISGGLTFPLMAFLLVEGFHATSNVNRYMVRLAVFGAISFIPHLFVFGSGLSIMFTLLAGLFLLGIRRTYGNSGIFWGALVCLSLATALFDWGIIGPIAIVMFDMIRNDKARRIIVPLFFAAGIVLYSAAISSLLAPFVDMDAVLKETSIAAAFFPIGSLLTIPLLLMYKGTRGRHARWFFYAFYPAHLFVLAIVSMLMGKNVLVTMIQEIMYMFESYF